MIDYKSIEARFGITELNEMQRAAMEAIPRPNDVVLISPTDSDITLTFLLLQRGIKCVNGGLWPDVNNYD